MAIVPRTPGTLHRVPERFVRWPISLHVDSVVPLPMTKSARRMMAYRIFRRRVRM